MSDNRGGGGLGFLGAAILLGAWLWWDGHLFAEWTLFVASPHLGQRIEHATSIAQFEHLGDCQVEAAGRRKGQNPLNRDGVFFCGLSCEVKQVFPDGSSARDSMKCRRLEPAPH